MTTTEIKDGRLVLLGANDGNTMDSIHASEIAAMARELLAHRRASQAAPAPSDAPKPIAEFGHGTLVVDTGHHYGTPSVFVGPSQRMGPVGGLVPDDEKMPKDRLIEGEFFFTFPTDDQAKRVADALVNAPAPSDALREAAAHANSWLRAALRCKDWNWDADQRELAERACSDLRAALSTPTEGEA